MPIAAASYQEMAEMRGGEGLPGDSASCQENGRTRGREESAVICQKMASMRGGEDMPLVATIYRSMAEMGCLLLFSLRSDALFLALRITAS
jgi:hypothetical protein